MKTLKIYYRLQKIKQTIYLLICLLLISGCEDFLEIDEPFGQVPHQEVYEDEATATAAVTTMYAKLRDEVLVTGTSFGMGALMGLYTDELEFYGNPWDPSLTFYYHQIVASDVGVESIWGKSYNLVYMSNAVLEGLESSPNLSVSVKNQLRGESLFIRSLAHFYLINLFGEIPYITTTDFEMNKEVLRMPKETIYENILLDLTEAKTLLGDTYISEERIRANKWAVSALLARVYLYMERWEEAEMESSLLMDNTLLFNLETDINNEFLKESTSAILQLKSKNTGANSQEGTTFIFVTAPPPFVALTNTLVAAMEGNDLRKTHWIGEVTDGNGTWYFPYKYKQYSNTGNSMEYSIVFRLAEQYLIRAEARARQHNISGAQDDLNRIRQRAGLANTTATDTESLLEAILNERRFELFTEHGHRWFDIRRFGVADEVLTPIKPGWSPTNVLLPIPEADLLTNPNLAPQNSGY
ncbi:hypothetical protein GGR32_002321 [Mesonia hippocampi]|uniref:RagB/SusD family nutrient uptake outer membrane protein n=1 Tax=Mesonia hippocampi TaxID=1628250 RepID=A0A840ENQ9_9FLAO|nr:RagB/SusD family nutrient uptake outer membrane protein [Mesonia hippocampi]MBB4120009.1 hypothetical protein [Mesonia hippocampi]